MLQRQQIIDEYKLNETITMSLVQTIPAERFTEQPQGIRNHPAWILGHLRVSEDTAYQMLTGKRLCNEHELEIFKIGSMPNSNPKHYPDKTTLIEQYLDMHKKMSNAIMEASQETLDSPMPIERIQDRFPTIGTFLLHVTTSHEGYHLGQMSTWRRAARLAP